MLVVNMFSSWKHEIEEQCADVGGIFFISTFQFYILDNEICQSQNSIVVDFT
jgi:hypothetical protein